MEAKRKHLESFAPGQRKKVLERDGNRCVFCGMGERDGVKLHVECIKPIDMGGKATIKNGQTLCSRHVFLKENFKRPRIGKSVFLHLFETAKTKHNTEFLDFCRQIMEVYERNDIRDIAGKR